MWMLAEEIRGHMASLGFKTLKEMVGRADALTVDESALFDKTKTLDLTPLLTPPPLQTGGRQGRAPCAASAS